MSRKNINDYLTNDRSVARSLRSEGQKYFDSWDQHMKGSTGGYVSKSSVALGPRCYASHKALVMPNTKLKIYGGSCSSPVVHDADVYIGFDSSMRFSDKHFPWNKGEEILFQVPDMGVPKNATQYKKLVDWTKEQLLAGQKVHAGCIGGHGRTGMFLAALVSMFGEEDAITYVREHYCKKAVESSSQVEFLKKEFGVKGTTATKASPKKYSVVSKDTAVERPAGDRSFKPLVGTLGIWGR
ncbi:hypothetical protein [Hyphomicrobium sp. ghe19]|uniref:protein-tyrosine phosphatase family protein n=1 Tax=Hyphomicrobium sp. ghe19 TaxID=2682968 RepID=UPI001366B119|nr:hypothetical protein HYPP_02517 [Hyphomicrobium sp. ghe19]